MSLLIEKSNLSVALETTVGTAVATDATGCVFPVRNLQIDRGIEMYRRNVRRQSFSKFKSIPGKQMGTFTFEVDMYGLPASNTVSGLGLLLQACGMVEASPADSYVYTTSSVETNHKSVTMAGFVDGTVQRICGARGTFVMRCVSGSPGVLAFTFMGCLEVLADSALLAPTYNANSGLPPAFLGATFSLGSVPAEAAFSQIEIDLGNVLVMKPLPTTTTGYQAAAIVDRVPTLTIDPEYQLVTDYDYESIWRAGTTSALSMVWGSAENKLTVTAPAVQYQNVGRGERDQIMTAEIEALLCGSAAAGDDELVITLGSA